jgi:putative transposase
VKYVSGTYYHVYNRGAHKAKIFKETENYRYLIRLLRRDVLRYDVALGAFCLMPNHYHLIVAQYKQGSVGDFLKVVFRSFSLGMNKRYGHAGTWFESQAKVKELNTEWYLLNALLYVHANPVAAGLVKRPEEWEFSDYAEWAGLRGVSGSANPLREHFYTDAEEYKKYMEENLGALTILAENFPEQD